MQVIEQRQRLRTFEISAADSCTITGGLGAGRLGGTGVGADRRQWRRSGPAAGGTAGGGGATVSNRTALMRWSSSAAFSPIACSSAASVSLTLATIACAVGSPLVGQSLHRPRRCPTHRYEPLHPVLVPWPGSGAWRPGCFDRCACKRRDDCRAFSTQQAGQQGQRGARRLQAVVVAGAGNNADFSFSVLTRLPIGSRASRALA